MERAVPYTLFREQAQADNVEEISSRGETIQGRFAAPVDYAKDAAKPAETTEVVEFSTERPSFADDNIFAVLDRNDVRVNARPTDESRPIWQTLLFSFGPTLLFIFLLFSIMGRASRASAGSAGSASRRPSATRRATRATTFDDVAGIDEAEGELVEIVDFLKNPDQLPAAGRHDPQGRAALGPARNRQDAAGPGRRRRGGRAVLLAVGVGVHRDDRRRRRQPRARPVPAGEGRRPGDHLHRRARRHRPRAGQRRQPRRPRRARADPQPDPHRDGRVHRRPRASSCWRRPTGPRSSTRRCCARAASTAASSSARPIRTVGRKILEVHTPRRAAGRRGRPRPARRRPRRAWSAPTSRTS